MFFFKHRLKITLLRIGKHRIVKNIASLRKVNIAHPYVHLLGNLGHLLGGHGHLLGDLFKPVGTKSQL